MKFLALALTAIFVFSATTSNAYARPGHDGGYHHGGGHGHGDGGADGFSLGILAGLTSADITSQANNYPEYKMAIVQGEDAALSVLQGAPISDLFINAKDATESLYNVQFGSEEEAALTILKLNQVYSVN